MYPLDNLGDYNTVRDDLFKFGGDVAKLYKNIGDTAVAEKTPALLAKGGVIGGVIVLTVGVGAQAVVKGVKFMKERKKMLDEKPNLEKQLIEQLAKDSELNEDISAETNGEEV